ncbi:MAG: HesA/MoeB/ThiF family protein [Thermoleophilaceae bacterium]
MTAATLPLRPRLKPSIDVFPASDGRIYLYRGGEDDFAIDADDPVVGELLASLTGELSADELADKLAADDHARGDEVRAAIAQLHDIGVIEDAASDLVLPERERERYERQLRYFSDVGPPRAARADHQRRLADARVVVLGLGGLGGWTAYALACTGIGRIDAVDADVVELSNLNRQILYREADLGAPKAQAAERTIRAFNSEIDFGAEQRELRGVADVREVVAGADFVVDAVDRPVHLIERWVNAACFAEGVPYIMMSQFPPLVRVGPTFVPGVTGCYACQEQEWRESFPLFDELVEHRRRHECPAASLGPACGLIGSQVALDVFHHLTGVCEPASLGAALVVDLRTLTVAREPVTRRADCRVCAQRVAKRGCVGTAAAVAR